MRHGNRRREWQALNRLREQCDEQRTKDNFGIAELLRRVGEGGRVEYTLEMS